MNGFTFYKNYYELIKYMNNKDRLSMYDAIFQYMFENITPDLQGQKNGVWVNLKMPLDTSKNKAGRGGAPKGNQNASKETTKKQPKNNQKTTKRETNNNISYFLFLISNFYLINNNLDLKNKIIEWLNYKQERKEIYKETGLKTLLTRIESATSQYGAENIIRLIDDCMANNYKGIVFEKLNKTQKKPEWFNKEFEKEELSETEQEEIKELLKSIE